MDIWEIYHFLFETYIGIGIMVGAGIVISLLLCVIFEFRTRKMFKNHDLPEEDEWSILEESFVEGEEEVLKEQ